MLKTFPNRPQEPIINIDVTRLQGFLEVENRQIALFKKYFRNFILHLIDK
ncbi:MAG: hypothetical protein LBQ24_01585 [Candidatus Peribacteria bacterium]|jgi:hypothetical protein|nr:hypothetical protein [Candidatus Peribacteria bacterium]